MINGKNTSSSTSKTDLYLAAYEEYHKGDEMRKRSAPVVMDQEEVEPKILLDDLNKQQKEFADIILEKSENVFLTGSAGVGKSFLLKYIIQELHDRHKSNEFGITASTGVAAARIGGQTLHSFSGVGLAKESAEDLYKRMSPYSRNVWYNVKILIIDEISMLDADLINKLDFIGRKIKNQEDLPFGGIQLIFCGDFYQLPPVSKANDGKFAFESKAFVEFQDDDEYSIKLLELTQVVRQKEIDTIRLLNNARVGEIQPKDLAKLRQLNLKVEKSQKRLAELVKDGIEPTKLYCKNKNVDAENIAHLQKLSGEECVIKAMDAWENISDGVKNRLQKQICESLPTEIPLKIDAQVMCTKNLKELGLVNGSRGVVTGFVVDESTLSYIPMVKFDNGVETEMTKHTEILKNGEHGEYRRQQLPLKLAWAVTIHKSQGMTLSRAILRLDDTFAFGQAYVALSRLSSFDGLFIEGDNIDASHVRADPEVTNFYENARRPIWLEEVLPNTPYEEMSLERLKQLVTEKHLTDFCIGYSDDNKDEYVKLLYWYEKENKNDNSSGFSI